VEIASNDRIFKNINRLSLSGYITLRVTNRVKPDNDEPSFNVPLFSVYVQGQCKMCGKPFTFVRCGDSTHMVIEQPCLLESNIKVYSSEISKKVYSNEIITLLEK